MDGASQWILTVARSTLSASIPRAEQGATRRVNRARVLRPELGRQLQLLTVSSRVEPKPDCTSEGDDSYGKKDDLVSGHFWQGDRREDSAKLTITYSDARRGQIVLDVNASEVADLAAKGTQQKRRGRRPKSA